MNKVLLLLFAIFLHIPLSVFPILMIWDMSILPAFGVEAPTFPVAISLLYLVAIMKLKISTTDTEPPVFPIQVFASYIGFHFALWFSVFACKFYHLIL